VATTVAPGGDAAPVAPSRPVGRTPRAATPSWRTRFVLMVVAAVLVGFALRVAIGLTDDAPATDETAYLRSGLSLVEGDGYQREGSPELHFPPFVPVLLGLASQVASDPHIGTVVLTWLSSTALIVPLALLGRRIGGPAAGIATAWVAALGPGLSTTIVNRGAGSEAEYTLLVVGAVWLVVSAVDHAARARAWRVFGAGVLVGLAYLTRPEGLFMAVPIGIAVLVLAARRPGQPARLPRLDVRGLRAGAPLLAVFVLPIVVCIVPYAMYLHDNTGKWQLSAKTQDASIEAWDAVARADRERRDSVLYALDETGLHFAAGRSSLATLAREDPAGYLGIVRTNAGELAASITNPVTDQRLSWLLLPLPLWGLAVFGAWRHRRSGVVRLLLAVGALPVATALAFFVQPRYLIVAVALATPLVGAAIAALSVTWRRPVMLAGVALLALSSVQAFHSEAAGWWHPSEHGDQREAGEWIAANTRPGDRVMTRSMVVEYYAERPTMAIPYASVDEILRYARHYGARYLVVDWYTAVRLRPQLEPLRTTDRIPGLRLAHEVRAEGRTTRIFALDPPPPSVGPIGSSLGFVGDGQS
jgi:4-amino-4-deoxy-L-arabinose transferase-like glycosyltransferase